MKLIDLLAMNFTVSSGLARTISFDLLFKYSQIFKNSKFSFLFLL